MIFQKKIIIIALLTIPIVSLANNNSKLTNPKQCLSLRTNFDSRKNYSATITNDQFSSEPICQKGFSAWVKILYDGNVVSEKSADILKQKQSITTIYNYFDLSKVRVEYGAN